MLRLMVVSRLLPLLALAPLLVGCGGAARSNVTGPRPSAPAATAQSAAEARTGPVAGSGSASCVEGYSPQALRHRAFAFDGTVVAIRPGGTNRPGKGWLDTAAVTFTVNEWFKGGARDTVTVDLMSPAAEVADDARPAYGKGTRLLVSGEPRWGGQPLEDAIAWTCGGFTSYYEPAVADTWRTATT